MKMKRKGFTLIELLVVIAIIALLLSVVVPALRKAREAGRRAVCGVHMHQVGLAIQMYADENKGFVPLHDGEMVPNGLYWTTYMYTGKITNLGFLVGDYIPIGSKIIFCPSNRVLLGHGTLSGFDEYMPANGWWDVWENIQNNTGWPYLPTSSDYRNLYCEERIEGRLERAGNKAILSDWFTNIQLTAPSATWAPQGVLEHHQKGYVVLYTDGSARFVVDSEKYVHNLGVLWDRNNESAKEAWRFFDTH